MITLNLATKNKEQELIKTYLENNVSETLAHKINNGVEIVKDTKLLINKKDLDGFMNYARDEAKKLVDNGKNYACVEDSTVYGWSIHYFEESSIEGTLYNKDGTEYKPPVKEKPKTESKTITKTEPPKPQNSQGSFFELFNTNPTEKEIIEEKEYEPDPLFDDEPLPPKENKIERLNDTTLIDTKTGEVIFEKQEKQLIDKKYISILNSLLDGKIEVKIWLKKNILNQFQSI